ncbi:hypothetical protein GW17_00058876, partial [Ensete ventricosum]
LPIFGNYMQEGVGVEAGQGGGRDVVDREDCDGLTVVDLGGNVSLVEKERMKSTNRWQQSSTGVESSIVR